MELPKNKKVKILFIISAIGAILSIVYISFLSIKQRDVELPFLLAYSDTHGVIMGTDNFLFHTDKAGTLLKKYNVKELGLNEYISDIVIIGDSLYVADAKSHDILSCSFPLSICQTLTHVPLLSGVEAMKIAFTPDKKHFYVSSSSAHKIDYFEKGGQRLYTLDLKGKLKYPNGIAVAQDGTLVVADTNHHRVIGIKHQDEKARIEWKIPISGYYNWPTYVAVDRNNAIWIAALDGFFDKGKVLISNDYSTTIEMPSSPQKPKMMRVAENGVIITDVEDFNYKLTDFSALFSRVFGDTSLNSELEVFYLQKKSYEMQILISQILIGVFLLALILIAIFEYKSTKDKSSLFTQAKVDTTMIQRLSKEVRLKSDGDGIIWLRINPKMAKNIKLIAYLIAWSNIALVGLFLYMDISDTPALLSLGALVLIAGGTALFAVKILGQRIGVIENTIYIEDIFGNIVSDKAENTIFSGRRVLVKKKAIGLYDGQGKAVFDEDELAVYVMPLMQKAQKKSEFQILIEQLSRGDLNTWLILLSTIAMFILVIMLEFQVIVF